MTPNRIQTMKKIIQCQEEVSSNKRSSFKSTTKSRPEPFASLEDKTHQCKHSAQYVIKHIDLYVCRTHAVGIDKKQLIKLK